MSRLLRRFAIAALSLALPLVAGAQQGVDDAGVRQGLPGAERGLGPRAMDSRRMDPRASLERPAPERQADSRRSLSEAVRRVQRRTGGQILGAELVPYEGRDITRIKYMDDRGRVRYMDDPGPGERLRHVPPAPRRDDNGQP